MIFVYVCSMKRAIIVGASSGLGMEVTKILLNDGWYVGIAARRTDVLTEIKNEFPERVITAHIDVTKEDAAASLLALISELGGIDLYFHASGIGSQNPSLLPEIENATVDTNVVGFTKMIDAMYTYMANHGGGHIAVISSIAGTKGLGPAPSYSATKAFQSTYIQALEQLANSQHLPIRFTDIRPGFVDTPLLKGGKYPLLMTPKYVANKIVKAIYARRHVQVVDWRYSILTCLWRLIPNWLWKRLVLVKSDK